MSCQGPVLLTVKYEVEPSKTEEFLEALHNFGRVRRRDGASRWGLYRDAEHPSHYVETFIVEFQFRWQVRSIDEQMHVIVIDQRRIRRMLLRH